MPGASRGSWRSVAVAGAIVIGVAAVVVVGSVVVLFSRYVRTESVESDAAAREFERTRDRFAGQLPLIEFRGFEEPIVRRTPSAPRHQLVALHVLAYSPADRELQRAEIPAHALRLMTVGGRLRFMNLGTFGDDRDRITLEDLERHGPGLVVDLAGSAVGQMLVGDAIFRTKSRGARLLMWTE